MVKSFSANELREMFLQFFESKKHSRVRSSPLLPQNDPTLLFANAGMNQFKDVFVGKEKSDFNRATSSQKCIRAGGKHNDLENVGFTKRHHTFFEMLGNFSFGDYFKDEAIAFAWEFLTEKVKLPKDKLWVSVFREDEEAADIWINKIGVSKERLVRMDEKDNFWEMGDTGPCGPCTEIHMDRGESFGKPGETIFDGGERFLEIWNLVFMQFDRAKDGILTPLPKPSVDTGMGLERLASIVQGVESNYHIDSMQKIVQSFAQILGVTYGKNLSEDQALHVLTDHIRACTFAITDGIQPSNEGRGYVLRRILRRAIRFGKKLGRGTPFFYQGVASVVEELGEAFPELKQNQSAVEKMIQFEEEKFFETLETGLKLLDEKTEGREKAGTLSGELAFKLYDTFGFPIDLTEIILQERGWRVDHAGFEKALEAQRQRSRASWKGSGGSAIEGVYKEIALRGVKTTFTGYDTLQDESRILALLKNGEEVKHLNPKEEGEVILEKTPFYAESGGQVGDLGVIQKGVETLMKILDCQKPVDGLFVMRGRLTKGALHVGDLVTAQVDEKTRTKTMINHTTTHVLHATLREVLGDHIKQAGSLVGPDYLRFDFSHFTGVTKEERRTIETIVNKRIQANPQAKLSEQTLDEAMKGGAIAFFEEKYGDRVRVLTIGDFSKELCGGTHLSELGVAKKFKITQETSVASGVRRIVAVTAEAAEVVEREEQEAIKETAKILGVPPVGIYSALRRLQGKPEEAPANSPEEALDLMSDALNAPAKEIPQRVKQLQKKREQKKSGPSTSINKEAFEKSLTTLENVSAVVDVVSVENPKELRPLSDQYKNHLKSGVILLGAAVDGKASVIVAVTDDIAKDFETKKFVGVLSEKLEGRGGGRDDFAQVGGTNESFLTKENLETVLSNHLKDLKLSA